MQKIIFIDTTHPINTRTSRLEKSLRKNFSTQVISWNRHQKKPSPAYNEHTLTTPIGYGNKIKKLLHLNKFFFYCKKIISNENPHIVLASHWDSLILATTIKKITSKQFKIVYDCLDLPTSNNFFTRKIIYFLERFCLKHCSLIILASRYFEYFYQNENFFILENYPNKVEVPPRNEKKIEKSISWIGVVRYKEIFERILDFLERSEFKLVIYGDGPDLDYIKNITNSRNLNAKIIFKGRYSSKELPNIYQASTLIWAAYPTKDFNAIYAISNKFHEASLFERSIIISQNTMMAQHSKSKNIIKVDEYNSSDIKNKIENFFNDQNNFLNYEKYTPDIFWEDIEQRLITKIKEI